MQNKESFYQDAVNLLTSQGKFHIDLGLKRVQDFLGLINNPQKDLKIIHVAGTNGKGSICAILSSILSAKGLNVGLFTSPHVFEYTERIKINNLEIEQEIFAKNLIEINDLAQKNDIHLTEFEILTVLAFDYFAKIKADIVVLETGLGGRFDATNVIENNICSIIAHIDFDHTERLGDTIEKIAFEKAGIIKSGRPVIISKKNPGFEIIKKVADDKNSTVIESEELKALPQDFALKGSYQKENLALALKAIEILNQKEFFIDETTIEQGLKQVKHPCRFEYKKEFNLIIDGAHNPNGTKALRESLDYYFSDKKIRFIFGCLKNKKYEEMMKNLFKAEDEIYFYHFNNPNSCSYEDLANACDFNSKPFDSFKADNNILTVVCGSFYMIKELLTKMGIK